MGRHKGSLSTAEAKDMAKELEQLTGTDYKTNLDYSRMVELLLCYRIAENVCEFPADTPIENKVTKVEIPLIGELEIKPSIFHDNHRLTNEPSIHFDFSFKPTSGFKADLMKAYVNRESEISDIYASLYGDRLRDLYRRFREE